MDQTITMPLEQYLDNIIQQIGEMENYSQVETLISDLTDQKTKHTISAQDQFRILEAKIESLSPIPLNSTQWSCLRYALICLRSLSPKLQTTAT
uniref:hypothetical protein n=1 Tax=Pedobacter schmidteae TaxID=2201271 RepID=UPI0013CE3F3A|nr:hypothetical protein [Pedobacter schmidteae]